MVEKERIITSYKKFLAITLVLAGMFLGYWALAQGVVEAPEITKSTPSSVTPSVSSNAIGESANQKTFTNSIGMEFVLIPAGEFEMGSPSNETEKDTDESPLHHVKIEKAFYIGKFEVTQKQWREVMGENPSFLDSDNLPVEQVSWNNVQGFIKKLNEKEGTNKYRLPSEAEWEYSARGGATTIYSFGDDESKLSEYAWYSDNSNGKTHEVGQKKPNPWGLYDMHGNVNEWVQDIYHSNYNDAPVDGSAWEGIGPLRVLRGCDLFTLADECRTAFRGFSPPNGRDFYIGFRLMRNL